MSPNRGPPRIWPRGTLPQNGNSNTRPKNVHQNTFLAPLSRTPSRYIKAVVLPGPTHCSKDSTADEAADHMSIDGPTETSAGHFGPMDIDRPEYNAFPDDPMDIDGPEYNAFPDDPMDIDGP
ncbi:hypothetical protein GQ53DRAFT_775562, partial [Thozetella sp. PMI_491]